MERYILPPFELRKIPIYWLKSISSDRLSSENKESNALNAREPRTFEFGPEFKFEFELELELQI